jgi:hypothetical protein
MPFSGTNGLHTDVYWTNHFERGLKPLIEEVKPLKARRSAPLRESILKQIISDLIVSPVLVADLTDYNPNVYWELGVRQSFKESGTVTIAEEGTKLPFDLGGKATLFYPTGGLAAWENFRGKFKAALDDCLMHPDKPDSPVFESVVGRGSLFEIFNRDQAIRRLDALLQELQANATTLTRIGQRAQKNLKGPKRNYTTIPLLLASTELLVANRFIDENGRFYKGAGAYLNIAAAINERLTLWPSRPIQTDKWLVRAIDDKAGGWNMKLRTEAFSDLVTKARDRLLARP